MRWLTTATTATTTSHDGDDDDDDDDDDDGGDDDEGSWRLETSIHEHEGRDGCCTRRGCE